MSRSPLLNDYFGNKAEIRYLSADETSVVLLNLRFRFLFLLVKMCRLYAWLRINFPVPVRRNRFLTPVWVFRYCPAMSAPLVLTSGPLPSQQTVLPSAVVARSVLRPPPEPRPPPLSPAPAADIP